VPPLPFDRILRYEELTRLLDQWAAAHPEIIEVQSIGVTPKGRKIWFLTLTARSTGPALEKPALLVDGNEHATEWAGGVAALHMAWRLVRDYGSDERVTRLLDTRCVYILPRMSPDGVEATLTEGRFIRSVDRPFPRLTRQPGIHPGDVDGDGRTLFIRYRDPNGPWKPHAADGRLLIPRTPDERDGEYWRVLPEGTIEAYDGVTIADAAPLEGIDLGQNFPGNLGDGAPVAEGAYPLSEPEVAAYVAAITERPNIVAHVTCHTFGGLVLTPPVNQGERLPSSDRLAYAALAARAATLTGYTAMSYLDLRATDREAYIPSAFAWLYGRKGIFSFITEFWNPLKAAGISLEGTTASAWLWGFHPVEDELKLLRWSDHDTGGRCFAPWRETTHPQLGRVEVGGWDVVNCFYNLPLDRLEREIAPHSEWLIELALSSPRLAIRAITTDPLPGGMWRVRLVVENTGWLPTNGAQQAIESGAVQPVSVELTMPAGARLVAGEPRQRLGQLAGRSEQRSTATPWGYRPGTPDRAFAEWIVAAAPGSRLALKASHERAGVVRSEVTLPSPAVR